MNLLIKLISFQMIASLLCLIYGQGEFSQITIETNVDSAGLFIDEKFIGVGNKFQINTETGVHSLIIVENLKEWNAEIIVDTIHIEKSKDLILNYNFKPSIFLNTNPQDVSVYKRDSLVGFTPLLLEAGFNELNLEKSEYTGAIITQKEISNGQIPELDYIGKPSKKEFYGSTLYKVLLGTAIALGAATAYYKLEADDLYEKYKITGDPGLVDNIDFYDDQSAGTFIAMEICVGALIYFFLAD